MKAFRQVPHRSLQVGAGIGAPVPVRATAGVERAFGGPVHPGVHRVVG